MIIMSFNGGNPIPNKDVPLSDTSTPADTLAARAAMGKGDNPISGALGLGKNVMELGEAFGIDKRTVGNMLLKSIFTGKFEFPGMKSETAKRKKLEVAVDQIIKLAWTMFGIFMIFQVFIVVVGLIM